MADIGSAGLLIIPHFDGLSRSVNQALASADTTSGGRRMGEGVSKGFNAGAKGLVGSGALMGIFSSVTSKAMDLVSSHVSSAVSRLDTLKNYPTVMQSLGVGADEAQTSIATMSDRLSNLPTRLDVMASAVQGIYAATKDYGTSLTQATNAGLAMNDMLLAGGQGTNVVNAAMEQFRQMLSKGKPDMQDWRSLMSAAPGQLDELAKSMLGPTANATALYYALGGGDEKTATAAGFEWATLSMSDLLDAIVRVDQEGGAGLASFQSQAEKATGGIQTAMDNAGNAITKGIANVMDSFGRENIVGAIDDVKTGINAVFSDLAGASSSAVPTVTRVWGELKGAVSDTYGVIRGVAQAVSPAIGPLVEFGTSLAPVIATMGAIRGAGSVASSAFQAVAGAAQSASGIASGASSVFMKLAESTGGRLSEGFLSAAAGADSLAGVMAGPMGIGLTVAGIGIAAVIGKTVELYQEQQHARQNAEDLSDALADINQTASDSAALSGYAGGIRDVYERSHEASQSMDDFVDSVEGHRDAMRKSTEEAQATIATLNTAEQIIDSAIGKTDLSAQAQGQLTWALKAVNDQLGTNITSEDVLNDKYTDQNGSVSSLKDSLGQLIEKRKEEARVSALESNLKESYEQQTEAARQQVSATRELNDAYKDEYDKAMKTGGVTKEVADAMARNSDAYKDAKDKLDAANESYEYATDGIKTYSDALGTASQAANEAGDAYSNAVNKALSNVDFGAKMQAAMDDAGTSSQQLAKDLEALGVTSEGLGSISDEQWAKLASDYDGTTVSIVGDLDRWNVGMDESKAKAVEATSGIRDAISGISGATKLLAGNNVDVDQLSTALQGMGVTAQEVSGISASEFRTMAVECGGDVNQLAAEIAAYNGVTIDPKSSSIDVNSLGLKTAQGDVLVWNGTALVSKATSATVDAQDVTDATGQVWTWDGTRLLPKSTTARATGNVPEGSAKAKIDQTNASTNAMRSKSVSTKATGNAADGSAASNLWNTVSAIGSLASKHVTTTVDQIINKIVKGGNAAGGIRPHADGGIRYHAGGAIATKAIPLDIVGEAGAEAIVPLTNRRYSQPFADVIAEGVSRRMGAGRVVNQHNTYNIYERDDAYVDAAIFGRAALAEIRGM